MNTISNSYSSQEKTPNNDTLFYEYTPNSTQEPGIAYVLQLETFFAKPTLKNAKRLLRAHKLPLPLEPLFKKPNRRKKNQEQKQKGGGTHFQELMMFDTCHDLVDCHPKETVYKMFKNHLPAGELKNAFLSSNHAFTRLAADYILQKNNMKNTLVDIGPNVDKTTHVQMSHMVRDKAPLKFVLDNIVASIKYNGTIPAAHVGLLGCAVILVLIANMKRLGLIKTYDTIEFYDGLFLRIDGDYIRKFIVLFLKSVKRLSQITTNVLVKDYHYASKQHTVYKPMYFNQAFPEFNATLHTTQVQIGSNFYDIKTSSNGKICVPHTKADVCQYVLADPNKSLWALNFLRDAFKADVAVAEDCVYITHDRLAFVYYKMIGGTRGFLIAFDELVGQYNLFI
jgi:hypothetical protein